MAEPVVSSNATYLSDCYSREVNYTGGRCWPGTYCPSGSAYPVSCDTGQYCAQWELHLPNGPCDAGYFCDGNATEPNPSHRTCPRGYYCEQGTGTPTPCDPGTLSNVLGATGPDYCSLCPDGYYCEGPAATNYTGSCAPGYFCPAGQHTATPAQYNCTIGHYCPGENVQPTPCPAGYYQDEILQDFCKDCPAGQYCDPVEVASGMGVAEHGVVTPAICPVGHYCPLNTEHKHEHPCPPGTFGNQTQLEQLDQCQPCSGGFYCDSYGMTGNFAMTFL